MGLFLVSLEPMFHLRQQVPRQMIQAALSVYLESPAVPQKMGSLGLGTGATHMEGCSRPHEVIIL